jgi:putative ABC transport system permease protein
MGLSLFHLLDLTVRSLRSNPLRAALSMLGVFMGVASVSATLQVGTISRAIVAQRLAERDAPHMSLYPDWQPGKPFSPFKSEDLVFLRQRLIGFAAISAANWAGELPTLFQDRETNPAVMAVSQDFLKMSGRSLLTGRFFTAADFEAYRAVVVIDQFLADELFQASKTDPLGQRLYIERRPYLVVGVVQTKLNFDEPPAGQVFIPMSVYQAVTGTQTIGSIQIRPRRLQDIDRLDEQAKQLLKQRFPNRIFESWSNVEDIQEQQEILQLASQALSVVGLIVLLVGGVGIANIMIASVTERTSEIGLRRAIGATQREIMLQFILEAIILSMVSGVAAIGVMHAVTLAIADSFDLPYQFEGQTAVLSLSAALLVGVGASFMPALQASRLDPAVALRSQ